MGKFSFLILLAVCFETNAQSSFGFSGGINAAQMRAVVDYSKYSSLDPNDPLLPFSGKVRQSSSVKALPSFGIFYVKDLDPSIGIKTELLFQGFGAKNLIHRRPISISAI